MTSGEKLLLYIWLLLNPIQPKYIVISSLVKKKDLRLWVSPNAGFMESFLHVLKPV